MRDLKLTAAQDLDVSGFDLAFVEGRACVSQQVGTRIRGFRGEWFLDLGWGVPWFQEILGQKPYNESRTTSAIRSELVKVQDVNEVAVTVDDFDSEIRTLSAVAEVAHAFGTSTVKLEEVFP